MVTDEPVLRAHDVDLLYVLAVHWFTLQNPGAPFAAPASHSSAASSNHTEGLGSVMYSPRTQASASAARSQPLSMPHTPATTAPLNAV